MRSLTCAIALWTGIVAATAAPGDKLPDPLDAEPSSLKTTYQLVDRQLQQLVPGPLAIDDDPFGGAPQVLGHREFEPEAAAAAARESLISKFGIAINSADGVEIEFPKRLRMVVTAPPRVQRSIARVLDGMMTPPQVQMKAHMFEPFVTSKATGSGLGLALVSKIIADHGGVISCDSMPGQTTFRMLLPIASREEIDAMAAEPEMVQ